MYVVIKIKNVMLKENKELENEMDFIGCVYIKQKNEYPTKILFVNCLIAPK